MKSFEQGNLAEAKAIPYFLERGFNVSIPFGTSSPYDLIVEREGRCYRVSVKSTSHKDNAFSWRVKIAQYARKKELPFDSKTSDLLFVYIVPENRCEIFHSKEIGAKYSFHIPCRVAKLADVSTCLVDEDQEISKV